MSDVQEKLKKEEGELAARQAEIRAAIEHNRGVLKQQEQNYAKTTMKLDGVRYALSLFEDKEEKDG